MPSFSPFDTTLWHATAMPAPATGPLEGRVKTDICIVGGGYTGMSSAIELRKRGHDVVLLEAQEAGFGGSGRNAGHCTPTFSYFSLDELRKLLGLERANRLIARQTAGADIAARYIQDYQISCEWKQNGYFQGALTPSRVERVRKKADAYASVGLDSGIVDAEEARRLTGSSRFYGGWLLKQGGHLNPLGYARGLARAVLQEGAELYTSSKVSKVERQGQRWHVRTDQGVVDAEKVIMATGAYTDGGWQGLDKTFRIKKVILAATSPLPEGVRARVIPFDGTMHDGRGDIFVYKYNREGRIVASMFPVGRRGRDLDFTREMLMDRLRWLHPEVPETTRWDYYWTGELDMQRNTIPRLYALGPGALACTGLSGRGVPTGTMLGGILADWAEGTPEPELALPVERLKSAPPYMSFAPGMVLRWYNLQDRIAAMRDGVELPPHA